MCRLEVAVGLLKNGSSVHIINKITLNRDRKESGYWDDQVRRGAEQRTAWKGLDNGSVSEDVSVDVS